MKEKNLDDYIYPTLIITSILLSLLVVCYNYFFPHTPIASCFIYKNFGIYCPGCGCTRAFLSLLNFDIISSFCYNPTVLYAIIILLIYIISQTIDRIFKHKKFIMPYSNIYLYIGIAILFLNCLFRNFLLIIYNIKL